MDANSNAGKINSCINAWKTNIKKEVKRQRLCSLTKFLFLVLALAATILLLIIVSLGLTEIPVWLKLFGVGLSVFLMFRGEFWPSGTLKTLFKDAIIGHRFYPDATSKLIEKNPVFNDQVKKELCKIVYRYKHNFDNPDLTYPDKMLDSMLKELCENIALTNTGCSLSGQQTNSTQDTHTT